MSRLYPIFTEFPNFIISRLITTEWNRKKLGYMEMRTCQNSKQLAKVFSGYFRSVIFAGILFATSAQQRQRKVVQTRPPHDAPR